MTVIDSKPTRTTVTLSDDLLRNAKQFAAKHGVTLSEFVAEAMRIRLLQADEARKRVRLPTFKSGGVRPGIDLRSNAAVQEVMDEGLPLEKLR